LALTTLQPNEHGDWLSMRNSSFDDFIPVEPEKKFDIKSNSFFNLNVVAINTARDAWAYSFSTEVLSEQMNRMIETYNKEVKKIKSLGKIKSDELDKVIENDLTKIKWSVNLKGDLIKGKTHEIGDFNRKCVYRPFNKQWLYYDRSFIERPGLSSNMFPSDLHSNYVICVTGIGASKDFSILMVNELSALDNIEKSQCFPLYYYEENKLQQKGLFDGDESQKYVRRDAISDFILERAKQQYGKTVTKEDIFYYVYGFLHSKEYRETFANDLKKMLPRLPLVENVKDFWAFSKAGRQLAELHLNYESVAPYPDVTVSGDDGKTYTVDKMRFPKKDQKETIHYNSKITVSNIPAKAYEYVVNGKSAIEWIMERYQVSTHKESGIVNDPNDWAKEVGKPRYILDLLLSIINVSVQTVDIVNSLPKVDFGAEPTETKVVQLYETREDSTISIAAEPGLKQDNNAE
jgi:predicted helicase